MPARVAISSGSKNASFGATVSGFTGAQTVTLTATAGTTSKTTTINLSGSASPVAPSISAFSCGNSSFTGAG